MTTLKALAALLLAALAVQATPQNGSKGNNKGYCPPVKLSGNPFVGRKLAVNPTYRNRAMSSLKGLKDQSLVPAAKVAANTGSFNWLSSIDDIKGLQAYIDSIPCEGEIGGLVIYDLPGRDCNALASNGELKTGEINRYKTEYIDAIAAILKRNPNKPLALVIEPDSLPNLATNMNNPKCKAAAAGYKEGITYALSKLNFPNLMMYIDAGHGGWLGYDSNLVPGAKLLAGVYKAAGKPSQVRGFSTNVSGYNAFRQRPGEWASNKDYSSNKAQDESRYAAMMGAALVAQGMPGHGITDTGRDGRTGIRKDWSHWCNVIGAGFGMKPRTIQGDEHVDALAWVKPPGESDGTSHQYADRYDAFCGKADAFKPSPEAGTWNAPYFEMLLKNAKPALAYAN